MTASQFSAGIFALGMSESEFASWLCLDRSTVYRWISGDIPVPRYAELIVHYMLKDKS